jgi:hypothetical protein
MPLEWSHSPYTQRNGEVLPQLARNARNAALIVSAVPQIALLFAGERGLADRTRIRPAPGNEDWQ